MGALQGAAHFLEIEYVRATNASCLSLEADELTWIMQPHPDTSEEISKIRCSFREGAREKERWYESGIIGRTSRVIEGANYSYDSEGREVEEFRDGGVSRGLGKVRVEEGKPSCATNTEVVDSRRSFVDHERVALFSGGQPSGDNSWAIDCVEFEPIRIREHEIALR